MGDSRDSGPEAKLAALLGPHLGTLKAVPTGPEASSIPEPAPQRLAEGELMELIFAHLDHENPRVCEGIDFDRIVILHEAEPESEPESESESESEPESDADADADADAEPEPPGLDAAHGSAWVGAGWADHVGPVPAALLDRPELTSAQRALLTRARRRSLATLNLRRLGRGEALRHLELFIYACRARRLPHCRVITGKGVHSRGEPVIKRAVLDWARGQPGVLGWAPMLDSHGEWGALVLSLSAPRSR